MKKLLAATALLLSFSSANAIDCNIYLKGNINSWATSAEYKFTPTADPDILYLPVANLSGEFKFADETWTNFDFGGAPYISNNLLEIGLGEYSCVRGGKNLYTKSLKDVVMVLDCHASYAPTLTVLSPEDFNIDEYKHPVPTDYYLCGSLHGYNWKTVPQYRFMETDHPGIYSLTVDELYGEFSILDCRNSLALGTSEITAGEWTPLSSLSTKITCGHLDNAVLELDTQDSSSPRLRISGTPHADESMPSGIYLMSDMSDSEFKARPRFEFRHIRGSNIHILKVPTLYSGFKFGSPDYNIDFGHVGNPGWLKIDGCGTYPLAAKGDAFISAPMIGLEFELDLSVASSPRLTIRKDPNADQHWREGFNLKFAEEFNGSALNPDRWTAYDGELPWWGAMSLCTSREENVSVKDGALHITARREQFAGKEFTAAELLSFQKIAYRYGRLDIRMKEPNIANGLTLCLWLLGYHYTGFSRGEIDLNEHGHANEILDGDLPTHFFAGTPAGPVNEPNARTFGTNVHLPYSVQDDQFHLYTMFWDKDRILMFLDYDKYPEAEPYYVQTIRREFPEDPYHPGNYFHHPYFLVFHMAVQQTAPEPIVSSPIDVTALNEANGQQASMLIDYVRIYQQDNEGDILATVGPSDDFSDILSVDSAEEPGIENSELPCYDLLGRSVANPSPGFYIRQGKKILITK